MICQRELGNYAEALKVYRRVREPLSVVRGVQPTGKTSAKKSKKKPKTTPAVQPVTK